MSLNTAQTIESLIKFNLTKRAIALLVALETKKSTKEITEICNEINNLKNALEKN